MHEKEHSHAVANPTQSHDDNVTRGHRHSSTLTAPTKPIESGILMRKARDANGVTAGAEAAVDEAAQSSGSPLPGQIMRKFEASLGTDLSSVRVHTGSESATAAHAVGARAYTTGQDIHFGAGQYDPSSASGQHLLAHEVAHTVQQRGGTPARQNKLEVSAPADAHETEADTAADAMVTGAPVSISRSAVSISREKAIDDSAAQGAQDMLATAAKEDLVIHASNATDISDASKALNLLEQNQQSIEKGIAMVAPHQSMSDWLQDYVRGKSHKPKMQIPIEAYAQNQAVINDLKLYIVAAGGQDMVTTGFKEQYAQLLVAYGRIDGVASKYAGTSLKDMKGPGAPGQVVGDAVGAGGNKTGDLAALFQELLKDPKVSGAKERVQTSTAELEKMPDRVSGDMMGVVNAAQTFMHAIHTSTTAEKGVNSLNLRNAFQAAKTQAEEAKKLTGSLKELVMTGGKAAATEVAKETAKAMVTTSGLALSNFGKIAATGAASGGTAAATAAAEKLVIGPAKDMAAQALDHANMAVGIIDPATQLDANIDAEATKQDTATVEAFKMAKATLATSQKTLLATITTWVKTAVELETKKLEVQANFKAFEDAIQKAAGARGKGQQGKALAEMSGFLHEAEQFVVQANVVLDIAQKGDVGKTTGDSVTAKAREALEKIKHRMVWMAHTYPFTNAKGETQTYYGAQEVNMKIIGPGLTPTADEAAGAGRADGFQLDGNKRAVNEALPAVVPNITAMRDKVLAVRAAIMAQVFGGG